MRIKERKDYFEINNGKNSYRLRKSLSSPMSQDELAEFYEREKRKGNPIPMNSIQHIQLFEDITKSRSNKLKFFLERKLIKNPITLTRVVYNSEGKKDQVIHNYGTSDAYTLTGDVVGENGLIGTMDNEDALKLLLGEEGIKKLTEISKGSYFSKIFLRRVDGKFDDESFESIVNFWGKTKHNYFTLDAWSSIGIPSNEGHCFLVQK